MDASISKLDSLKIEKGNSVRILGCGNYGIVLKMENHDFLKTTTSETREYVSVKLCPYQLHGISVESSEAAKLIVNPSLRLLYLHEALSESRHIFSKFVRNLLEARENSEDMESEGGDPDFMQMTDDLVSYLKSAHGVEGREGMIMQMNKLLERVPVTSGAEMALLVTTFVWFGKDGELKRCLKMEKALGLDEQEVPKPGTFFKDDGREFILRLHPRKLDVPGCDVVAFLSKPCPFDLKKYGEQLHMYPRWKCEVCGEDLDRVRVYCCLKCRSSSVRYCSVEHRDADKTHQSVCKSSPREGSETVPSQCRDFREAEIQRLVSQLVKALECLHKNGIYHNDVKLDNILLDNYKNVKLTDFGIATYTVTGGDHYSVEARKDVEEKNRPFTVYFDCVRTVIVIVDLIFQNPEDYFEFGPKNTTISLKKKVRLPYHLLFLERLVGKLDTKEPEAWLTMKEIRTEVAKWGCKMGDGRDWIFNSHKELEVRVDDLEWDVGKLKWKVGNMEARMERLEHKLKKIVGVAFDHSEAQGKRLHEMRRK